VFAEERQQKIAELVAGTGRVSVTHLAERFRITTETVRRDLATLEVAGTVRRVHGGAVATDRFSTTEESITERAIQRPDQKVRIAEAALALIPRTSPGSVLIDGGTTTEVLADLLSRRTAVEPSKPEQNPGPNWWPSPTPFPSPASFPTFPELRSMSWAEESAESRRLP
jgi:DeoR family fructose operon transcriptional repressor